MTGPIESTSMTKFTTDTPVVVRHSDIDEAYKATIIAIAEGTAAPIVVRVEYDDAPEVVCFYQDGSRDNDGLYPKLVELKKNTSIFVNLYTPHGGQGNFRADRETCEDTNRGGRRAVLEVLYEGSIPIAAALHHDARYLPDGFNAVDGE